MDWLVRTFIYPIFFGLDCVVYGLIQSVYNLFFQLSNVSILADTTIESFAQRIYVIVGVFMMFKVAISLITMMVSPDKIQSGGGKLVQRIVISLVLLVVAPNIFTLAYRIQSYIIRDNVLGNLILGASSASDADLEASYEDGGQTISVQVFKGFFHPVNSSIEVKTPDQCSGETGNDPACIYATADSVDDFGDIIASHDYDYSFVISTVAGAYVAWMLVLYCFDIAVRAVKLAFLQLIAPVPILAYIDESKGNNVFNNWLKQCTSSFLSLFIRLITIYFVIFIISEIVRQNGLGYYMFDADTQQYVYSSVGSNWLLGAFIIIGLLLFAKQVPKLIEDVTGIQSEKAFSSNGTSAFFGALGGSLVGGAANLVANRMGASRYKREHMKYDKKTGKWEWDSDDSAKAYQDKFSRRKALTASLGGLGYGLASGGRLGMSGKGIKDSIGGGRRSAVNARRAREMGFGLMDSIYDKFTDQIALEEAYGTQDFLKSEAKRLRMEKENADLAEHSAQEAYSRQLGSVGGQYQDGLIKAFKSFGDRDDVTYDDYLIYMGREQNLISDTLTDADIAKMRDEDQAAYAKLKKSIKSRGKLLKDENEFAGIAAQFNERNRQNKRGNDLDKQITKNQELRDSRKKS